MDDVAAGRRRDGRRHGSGEQRQRHRDHGETRKGVGEAWGEPAGEPAGRTTHVQPTSCSLGGGGYRTDTMLPAGAVPAHRHDGGNRPEAVPILGWLAGTSYFDADSAEPTAACPAERRAVSTRNGEQLT